MEVHQERINWLRRAGGILISPRATLEEVAKRPDWVIPCMFLFILPVSTALVYPSLPGGIILGLAIDLAIMAGLWVAKSGIIWSLGRTPGDGTRFYSVFSVLGYALFPSFVNGLFETVLRLFNARFLVYTNTNLYFLLNRMGILETLYRGSHTLIIVLNAIIGSISIFNFWSFYLVFLGIRSVFGFGVQKAVAFTFLYWIVQVVFFITMLLLTL